MSAKQETEIRDLLRLHTSLLVRNNLGLPILCPAVVSVHDVVVSGPTRVRTGVVYAIELVVFPKAIPITAPDSCSTTGDSLIMSS
jgi:hypothetical protein